MAISFTASKNINFTDIDELNKKLGPMADPFKVMHDLVNDWYYLLSCRNSCLFIEDYNPTTKTFRNVRRTFGNSGERVLDLIQKNSSITFQHEEDGWEDPSPNSISELIKHHGIRLHSNRRRAR